MRTRLRLRSLPICLDAQTRYFFKGFQLRMEALSIPGRSRPLAPTGRSRPLAPTGRSRPLASPLFLSCLSPRGYASRWRRDAYPRGIARPLFFVGTVIMNRSSVVCIYRLRIRRTTFRVCLGRPSSRRKFPKVPERESWDWAEQKSLYEINSPQILGE